MYIHTYRQTGHTTVTVLEVSRTNLGQTDLGFFCSSVCGLVLYLGGLRGTAAMITDRSLCDKRSRGRRLQGGNSWVVG